MVMEERNEEWKKIRGKMNRENDKFPSIYKSSETYRSKVEEKEKGVKTEELSNLNSSKW